MDLAESESLDAPEGTYRREEEVKKEELVQEELLDVEGPGKERGHEPREVCVMRERERERERERVIVCVCVCFCGRALFPKKKEGGRCARENVWFRLRLSLAL